MTACTRPVADFTPEQRRFPPVAGFTVRADFAGGEVSSDLGALLLSAVDRRIGLIDRLTAAIADSHHASYIKHPLRDLLSQRVFQIVSGYEDGNDANTLRRDPLFKLAAERTQLDSDNLLACGATHSRLEGSLRRSDIYRMARALVEQFIACYRCAPSNITLNLDHTGDATYGQQALADTRQIVLHLRQGLTALLLDAGELGFARLALARARQQQALRLEALRPASPPELLPGFP